MAACLNGNQNIFKGCATGPALAKRMQARSKPNLSSSPTNFSTHPRPWACFSSEHIRSKRLGKQSGRKDLYALLHRFLCVLSSVASHGACNATWEIKKATRAE